MARNQVTLIDFYGSDRTHALSAWTSTERQIDEAREKRLKPMLIQLAQNGHHTPFEKSFLHFLIRTDVATHIQLLKHRIGVSVNAESARYKELKENSCLTPQDWPEYLQAELEQHFERSAAKYHFAIRELEPLVGRKRAKESARFFLPYCHQLSADVSFNFRSFMHFLKLRIAPDAQLEIREVAERMLEQVWRVGAFDLSLEAFGYGMVK